MLGLGTSLSSLYVPQGATGYTADNTYSVAMDGTDDRIHAPNFNTTLQGSFSIGFWIKFPTHSSTEYVIGLSNSVYDGGWIANRFYFTRKTDGSFTWRFQPHNVNSSYNSPASNIIQDDTWHHILISTQKTGTGSTESVVKIWVDGSPITLTATAGPITAAQHGAWAGGSSPIQIGAYSNNVTEVTAWFDWGIWNTHMDNDNATAIYNDGNPIDVTSNSGNYNKSSSMVCYYKLDEGTGTTATDSVGSNNGTLENGASWVTDVPS